VEARLHEGKMLSHPIKASFFALLRSKHLPLVIALRNIAPGGDLGHAKNLSDP
jgi:hypothetical protein